MIRRTFINTARKTALIIVAVTTLSAQAHASVGQVCLELPAGAGVVKAEISSGCLSSGGNYQADFEIATDGERALISIDGNFNEDFSRRIGTADCMGSRTIKQQADAAGPRRYSVTVNGEYRGVIDASDTMFGMVAVRQCFAGSHQRRRPQAGIETTYTKSTFRNWIAQAPSNRDTQNTADGFSNLADLAASLQSGHPDRLEGRPSVQVSISPGRWRRLPFRTADDDSFMAIRVEEHGYADDSVSGMRIFATARFDDQTQNWKLLDRWHQFMCARGPRAGQWTAQPCE